LVEHEFVGSSVFIFTDEIIGFEVDLGRSGLGLELLLERGDLSLQGRDSFRALGALLNDSFLPLEVHSILSRALGVESFLA